MVVALLVVMALALMVVVLVVLIVVAAAGARRDVVLAGRGPGGHLDLVRDDRQLQLAIRLAAGHVDHGERLRLGVDHERGAVGDIEHRPGLLPVFRL